MMRKVFAGDEMMHSPKRRTDTPDSNHSKYRDLSIINTESVYRAHPQAIGHYIHFLRVKKTLAPRVLAETGGFSAIEVAGT